MITCDRCGARIVWYPVELPWIQTFWASFTSDARHFIPKNRVGDETFRDICPACAEEIFWIPAAGDAAPTTSADS